MKRGGVCAYFRECLPVRVMPNHYLSEFELFLSNLENLLADITSRNPHFLLLLGNFNAKSETWFINDKSSNEGTQLESLTSLYGMTQQIAEPTHVLENSSYLIFFFPQMVA